MSKPRLTKLDSLSVSGQTEYAPGGELNLTVTANYTSGYRRDVTPCVTCSGFDFAEYGFQTVTVSYEEYGVRMDASFDIYVIPPDTLPPEPPAETATEPEMQPPAEGEEPAQSMLPALYIAGICILLLAALLYLKAKRAKKRRRRPRPTIKLD